MKVNFGLLATGTVFLTLMLIAASSLLNANSGPKYTAGNCFYDSSVKVKITKTTEKHYHLAYVVMFFEMEDIILHKELENKLIKHDVKVFDCKGEQYEHGSL